MQVSNLEHRAPIGKSDHDVILFYFHCYLDFTKPKEKFVFEKGKFDDMRTNLKDSGWKDDFISKAAQMSNTESPSRVEDCWKSFKKKMLDLRDQFIPKRSVSGIPSWTEKGSFPIDKQAREAIKNKNRKHRAWTSSLCTSDRHKTRLEYTRARNKAKTLLRKTKRKFEKGIATQCKSNPKGFWAYTRSKMKAKIGIAPLLSNPKDKESLMFEDEEIANVLQDQFSNVFTRESDGDVPSLPCRTTFVIDGLHVTEEMVLTALRLLNISKSCGPD